MSNKVATIHFEDHGQDFLEWDIDDEGTIIDCRPFQYSVWEGWVVTNDNGLQVKGLVSIARQIKFDDGRDAIETMDIKYPIEKIVRNYGGG